MLAPRMSPTTKSNSSFGPMTRWSCGPDDLPAVVVAGGTVLDMAREFASSKTHATRPACRFFPVTIAMLARRRRRRRSSIGGRVVRSAELFRVARRTAGTNGLTRPRAAEDSATPAERPRRHGVSQYHRDGASCRGAPVLARALRVLTRSPRLSGAGQALPGAVDRAGAPGAPLRKRATAQCLGGSADLGRRARSTEFGAHLRSGGSRGMGQDGRSAGRGAP